MENGRVGTGTDRDTNIPQLKKRIRAEILSARERILAPDRERYGQKIKKNVISLAEYREADAVLAYANYRSEVDTAGLIKQALADGKIVFAPRVSGSEMEFWRITSEQDLRAGYRGIPEPALTVSFPEWLMDEGRGERTIKVMMWMPGVAFDRKKRRIGYGGGFYDRYLDHLEEWKAKKQEARNIFGLTTAALAYACQIVEEVPLEEHDRKPDLVVTENEVIS